MRSALKILLFSILAGLGISLGGFLNIICLTYIPNILLSKLIGSILFPIGLMLICIFRLSLYTGKIGFVLDNDNKQRPCTLIIIFIGNIIGTVIPGLLLHYICNDQIMQTVDNIVNIKSNTTLINALIGSMLCGLLVYIAIYGFKVNKNIILKLLSIEIPILLFVFAGYDHCIANSFYLTFGFGWSATSIVAFINVIIGNSIGAILTNKIIK